MDARTEFILVTGGAGFLGAHLCRRLLSEGHRVHCLDSLWTSRPDSLAGLVENPNFTHVVGDVRQLLLQDIPFRPTQIYHLACPASPPHYQARPWDTIETCTEGTRRVLEVARVAGATVLLTSTSEIYGEPEVHPQPETYRGSVSCTGPRSCYDEGKRAAEAAVLAHRLQFKTRVKIVRIFNTYGPGMAADDGRVVSNFCVQALRGQPLTVYGSGQQTRSLCYVDDLIEGLVRMMASGDEVTGPINLGNPVECTMVDLARHVVRAVAPYRRRDHGGDDDGEHSAHIVYKPLPVDDPTRRCPSIDVARRVLRWEPRTNLGDGLAKTVAFFTSNGDEEK